MTYTTSSGRGWAYTGVILGGLVSIAANVAHSFIPPQGSPASWAPEPGAVVGAIVWPVFLFVAVEILARVGWPHGLAWQILRWAGLLPVAFVAALVSYRHLSGLLAHYGEEPIVSVFGPLAVDGLMVMATGALLATGRRQTTPVSDPVAIPAAPGGPATPTTAPPVETPTPADPVPTPAPARRATAVPAVVVPSPAEVVARLTLPRPTTVPAVSAPAIRPAARPARRPRPTSPATPAPTLAPSTTDPHVTASDAAHLALPVVPPDLLARARQVARQYRTDHGTPITAGQLAVRLKVTSEQATQALAVLNLDPNSPTTPIPTVNGNRPEATR